MISMLTEDKANQVYDIFLTVKPENKSKKVHKKREYVPDTKYTESSRADRMERFMKSAGKIEIDEKAIFELRERSMI